MVPFLSPRRAIIKAATAGLTVLIASSAWATTFELDSSHSEVGFRVRHFTVSWTRGRFDVFSGTLELDEKDVNKSKVKVTIDARSVNTNLKMRDDNLRGADFLDVANNPTLTFESRRIESASGRLRITGDLTIRGVTRSVALDAEPISPEIKGLFGEYRRGTRAVGKISRKEFGLKSNTVLEAGALAVGDEIEITLEVEFKRKAQGAVDNP